MMTIRNVFVFLLLSGLAAGCAATKPATQAAPPPAQGETKAAAIDAGLQEAAAALIAQIPQDRRQIAITGVDAETAALADYALSVLQAGLNTTGVKVIDRANADKIAAELEYQFNGNIADDSLPRLGVQYGVQTLVSGRLDAVGDGWLLSLNVTDVETMQAYPITKMLPRDPRFVIDENNIDQVIERAIFELGREVRGRMKIALGSISRDELGTTTDLSEYLKQSISRNALKHHFQVIGENGEAAQALVEGRFTPDETGIEVNLELRSPGKELLGASTFRISAAAAGDRPGWLLPPNTSKSDYEKKMELLRDYTGKNNPFTLTIKVDHPDGIYYLGDGLTVSLYANQDCYFKILHINAENKVEVFYPYEAGDRNFIKAGETRKLPDTWKVILKEPLGPEYFVVGAYKDPFSVEAEQPDTAAFSASRVNSLLTVKGFGRVGQNTGTVQFNENTPPLATAQVTYSLLEKQTSGRDR